MECRRDNGRAVVTLARPTWHTPQEKPTRVVMTLAGVMARSADLGTVEDQSFLIRDFRLQNGTIMPQAEIAYEMYGRLAPDGRNAVLITHGYTSSHHAAGRNPANGNRPGWWDGLI